MSEVPVQSGASPDGYPASRLTVLIPAYNESKLLADTLRSIEEQTVRPARVIVVDDCSTDATPEIARSFGVDVVRPPKNTGSKSSALNYGLSQVTTEFVLTIDADTMLAPDAIERLMPAFEDPKVYAACGYVLPRHVKTMWERGRYVEYLFAFSLYKPIQDYYGKPMIASGCFTAYRTEILNKVGGWPHRTIAEDMDLTWELYFRGGSVRFVMDAVCYPVEPHNWHFLSKQLKRWCHGFVQCVRLHWRRVLETPDLRMIVAVAVWDSTIASLAYLLFLPLLAITVSPWFLLGYLADLPTVVVPVIYQAGRRGELMKALASIPSFFVLRLVNAVFTLRAYVMELLLRRSLVVFEKGH